VAALARQRQGQNVRLNPFGLAGQLGDRRGLSSAQLFAAVCLGKSTTLDDNLDVINARIGCERRVKVLNLMPAAMSSQARPSRGHVKPTFLLP